MSDTLHKLDGILETLEKAVAMPSIKPPKPPSVNTAPKIDAPKAPSLTPSSKKNPVNVAQQTQEPGMKDAAMAAAKEKLTLAKNGQWALSQDPMDKGDPQLNAGGVASIRGAFGGSSSTTPPPSINKGDAEK